MKPLIVLLMVLSFVTATHAATDPSDVLGIAFEQKPGAALPLSLGFTDETGRTVRLGALIHDRPTLLALIYFRCPNLCGVVLGDLLSGLSETNLVPGRDYTLLAVSIDPAETAQDAAAAKRRHVADFPEEGAARGWHFLTGGAPAVEQLEQAVGYRARYDAGSRQFIHPAGVVIVTPSGRISRYLLGVGYQPGDLRRGVLDASTGAIARAARSILLTCWHYDPATGRYSLAIISVLRAAGILTVAAIAGALCLTFRREGKAR